VADAILLRQAQFCHCPLAILDKEDWIIAKTACAAFFRYDFAFADPLCGIRFPCWGDERHTATEAGCPGTGMGLEQFEQ